MIPEYKLYHGAVLSELIDVAISDVSIGELHEEGRLSSYIINRSVGLHIKHSTARLPPWQFTITKTNLVDLFQLTKNYRGCFIACVCGMDGIVALSIDEVSQLIETNLSDQAWIRVDRSRRQQYRVSGNRTALPYKKNKELSVIIDALN